MRAFLYACTTAADLGQTVFDQKLPELRLYAAARGWEVAGEYFDAIPTGIGKRPAFDALCAALGGGGDVVLATTISDLCWDLATGLARLRELGLGARCALVCTRDSFDATTPAGQLRLLDAMALVADHRRGRAQTRQLIGNLRALAKANGTSISGRPRGLLHIMELKALYERGLSLSEMIATLTAADWTVSKSKVSALIRTAREAGDLGPESESKRAAALAARGGLHRGGRKARGGELAIDQVRPLYESGLSQAGIVAALASTGWTGTRSRLAAALHAFTAAGDLGPESEERRAAAIEERRERRRAAKARRAKGA